MRALVVYCHPRRGSFTAAVRDVVLSKLAEAGAQSRLIDLYACNFDPRLSADEHQDYENLDKNRRLVGNHVADLKWCDTLIFVYPDLVVRTAGHTERMVGPRSGAGVRLSDAGCGTQ